MSGGICKSRDVERGPPAPLQGFRSAAVMLTVLDAQAADLLRDGGQRLGRDLRVPGRVVKGMHAGYGSDSGRWSPLASTSEKRRDAVVTSAVSTAVLE